MRITFVLTLLTLLLTAGCMGSTTTPAATRAAPAATGIGGNGSVLTLLNQQRRAVGLPPVDQSRQLDRIAMAHAQDQVQGGFFGHVGSNGSTVHARMRASGYDACLSAENVAMGLPDEASVMAQWMASPGHRSNILHPRAEQVGIARAGDLWVMVLARPC